MPVIHNQPLAKPLVNIAPIDERMASVTALSKTQKQQLWQGIRRTNPALAKLLKEDENVKALQDSFQARLQLPVKELNRYMQAGQQTTPKQKG